MRSKFPALLSFLLVGILFVSGIVFTPAYALGQVPSLPADQSYTISGNAGVEGVTLKYNDDVGAPQVATTDSNGDYSFSVPAGWSGKVTPFKLAYVFTPTSIDYNNVLSDQTNQNYGASIALTYTISGTAYIGGVTLSYDDGGPHVATTDAHGDYSFTVSAGWSGTVTPSRVGYTFMPASIDYTNVLSDQIDNDYGDYIIDSHEISGNAGVGGATLSYDDGFPQVAIAEDNGHYAFDVYSGWSGTVTASKAGYTFTPASIDYTNVLNDQSDQNYTAAAITYTISGNTGVGGATLNYTDGHLHRVTADDNGDYSFKVSFGWNGTVTPAKLGYAFTPTSTDYNNVLSNQTGQNYSANSVATYTISGHAGVARATLSYDDQGIQVTAAADDNGDYTVIVPSGWAGTITPSKSGYAFTPAGRDYATVSSSQTSQNYTVAIRKQVSSGQNHSCGIKPGGTLHCWGDNTDGQSTPPAGIYTQVGVGNWHSCALKLDGTVVCWGSSEDGLSSSPNGVFDEISVGDYVSCGMRPDHTLACWGDDGDGAISNVPAGIFKRVSAGGFHVCAIKMDDTLFCWGQDYYNQISHAPTDMFSQLSGAWDYSCGIRTDGTLACWGADDNHQWSKTQPPSGTFVQVSTGEDHACALKSDGSVACWGDDLYGQVSNIPPGTFTQVSVGYGYTCGLRSDDQHWVCWGGGENKALVRPYSISGQIGAGYATLRYDDGGPQTVTAGGDGTYTLYVSDGWAGTVTVSEAECTFKPPSRTYSTINTNWIKQNYTLTLTLTSAGAQDGWILESKAGSGKGGLTNATSNAIVLGDDAANRQYRAILSFNNKHSIIATSVASAVVKLYRSSQTGTDPFKALGNLLLDMQFWPFGTTKALQPGDFNDMTTFAPKAGGTVTHVGNWYSIPLKAAGRNRLLPNRDLWQFKLYFNLPSNGNKAPNYIDFVSGNGPIASYRPQLVITFNPLP